MTEQISANKTGREAPVKTIGLIVNPIAGMGGAVALKGTDGGEILKKALSLGAKPVASARACAFLSELRSTGRKLHFIVGAGDMGEQQIQNYMFTTTVVGEKKRETTPEDTKITAKRIVEARADLLVFCGGDGTARDVLEIADRNIPVLGVPTGVKMHSAAFAVNPKAAAHIASSFLSGEIPLQECEVMDVDEEAFRKGRVSAELYGYLLVPYEPLLIQQAKMATPMTESELRNQAAIAVYVIENMKPDTVYILGPGTTTRTIADLLDTEKTLLGVDIFLNKKIIVHDANEEQILQSIQGKLVQIIVTPIGGQGFVFGRGNQQISPRVIRKVGLDNILVVSSQSKLRSLRNLRVDTGNARLDEAFQRRKLTVIADYKTEYLMPVAGD
jgi:predicted polyphosphate/ATP-dependent NAD kinase